MEAEASMIVQTGPAAIVVLPAGSQSNGLDARLRDVVTADDALTSFLEQLTAIGLREAPAFLLAAFDGPVVRLLVRGDVAATVIAPGGAVAVPPAVGVSTWSEHAVEGATDLIVRVGPTEHRLVLNARPPSAPATGVGDPSAGETILSFPDAAIEAEPPRAEPPPAPQPSPSAPAPAPAAETTAKAEVVEVAELGNLFETRYRGVGGAVVRPDAAGTDSVLPSNPGLIASVPPASGASSPPPPNAPLHAPPSPPAVPRPGEHDGLTVVGPELTALRKSLAAGLVATPGAGASAGGTKVQAVLCPSGHPNPPAAAMCQSCANAIADRTIHYVPRPVVGRLLFDSGMTVNVDRRVVIGRRPASDPNGNVDDLPALVTLPDPETLLSRTHAEIKVDGWNLSIVDLRSENGTFVVPVGQYEPMRLRSHDPYPLSSGMRIEFADVTGCRYEAGAA